MIALTITVQSENRIEEEAGLTEEVKGEEAKHENSLERKKQKLVADESHILGEIAESLNNVMPTKLTERSGSPTSQQINEVEESLQPDKLSVKNDNK